VRAGGWAGCAGRRRSLAPHARVCLCRSYRALELLRASVKRNDYMMTTQARVVAMTCTHAAIMRHRLHELRFHYDSVVMEEAAQVTEIETFIPIALQRDDSARTGAPPILKRLVLIGDHNQLPPVVTNLALQQHSGMEQSLFTRWVRLGTPIVQLDAQGRARPSIARLYNWQYKSLGDLPHCMTVCACVCVFMCVCARAVYLRARACEAAICCGVVCRR
jgi:intron-binding protein aquarius